VDNAITTKHNLDFLSTSWNLNPDFSVFKIGSVEGLWFCDGASYCIVALENSEPHNGHLDDVFEWFEHSCKRDGYTLRILELFNSKFKSHLIGKRGFVDVGENNLEKKFK